MSKMFDKLLTDRAILQLRTTENFLQISTDGIYKANDCESCKGYDECMKEGDSFEQSI